MNIIGIGTLLLTIIGWGITAYFQRQILERQVKAEKEKQDRDFAHEKVMNDRQIRLEVLPLAREKMIDAFSRISYLGRRLIEYPDFESLPGASIVEWIKRLEFTETQKEELLMGLTKKHIT